MKRSHIVEFGVHFGREYPKLPMYLAEMALRKGAAHARIALAHCERDLTEREQAQQQNIRAWFTEHFGKCVFCGDPRGCTVKLCPPSGNTNDWDKEGICVPTA